MFSSGRPLTMKDPSAISTVTYMEREREGDTHTHTHTNEKEKHRRENVDR